MILRRFVQNIKAQNWFAVGIDLFVLIIGIFLGLQVTTWNEERQSRSDEKRYLTRLHPEVIEVINTAKVSFEVKYIVHQNLLQILNIFDENIEISKLTRLQCYSLFSSHIYDVGTIALPTINELISNGQLSRIQNEDVRRSITKYSIGLENLDDLLVDILADRLVLARKYPEMIELDIKTINPFEYKSINNRCNLDLMRKSNAFRNDLIDNAARHNTYVNVYSHQIDLLKNIHHELDRILTISHQNE